VSYNLPFQEGSEIVELGGGNNSIIKRIPQLKCVNVDVRQVEGVDIVRDLEGDFSDIGPFDGLFAQYVAEHISWPKVTGFLSNCFKILRGGGVAVFVVPDTYGQMKKIMLKSAGEISFDDSNFLFGGQDYSDNTHKWLLSKPFFTRLLLEAGFSRVKITDHMDPEARDMFVEAYKDEEREEVKPVILVGAVADVETKINMGSFTVTFPGWINCDIRGDIKEAVEAKGHIFEHCDVTKPVRWKNDSVSIITAHHLIEHLSREEGAFFLGECCRILKPGGVIRLSTPDIDKFIVHYKANDFKEKYAEEFEVGNAEDDVDAFFRLAFMGHKTIYNYPSLRIKMEKAGLTNVRLMVYGASRSPVIMSETEDSFPNHSLYIEASKSNTPPQHLLYSHVEQLIDKGAISWNE